MFIYFLLEETSRENCFSDHRHALSSTKRLSRKRVTLYIRHIRDIYRGYLSILRNYIIDIYGTAPRIAVFQLIQTVNYIVLLYRAIEMHFVLTRANSLLIY